MPGLSLDSHAARCAQMFGLPPDIVQRAQYVKSVSPPTLGDVQVLTYTCILCVVHDISSLLATHNIMALHDEAMTEAEMRELEEEKRREAEREAEREDEGEGYE